MNARIYLENKTQPNYVTVEEDNPRAEWDDGAPARISTTYFCPSDGGYVRIHDAAGRYPQVCDGLSSTGSTLRCSDGNHLIDLIRRERRAGIRKEQRYLNSL